MKTIHNKTSYKIAEFLLTAGVLVLGGALARKTLYETTGDEVLRVHRIIDKKLKGVTGVVIEGDTLWQIPKKSSQYQPK